VQCREERSGFYFERAVRDLFDAMRDGESVELSVHQRLED
jgi:hypothetical protein